RSQTSAAPAQSQPRTRTFTRSSGKYNQGAKKGRFLTTLGAPVPCRRKAKVSGRNKMLGECIEWIATLVECTSYAGRRNSAVKRATARRASKLQTFLADATKDPKRHVRGLPLANLAENSGLRKVVFQIGKAQSLFKAL